MTKKMEYPRKPRYQLEGEVLVKRPGKPILKSRRGNVSEGGLFIELENHDLAKGRRVEIIFVREDGAVRDMERMTGIVIRIDSTGVALVTYKASDLRRDDNDPVSENRI